MPAGPPSERVVKPLLPYILAFVAGFLLISSFTAYRVRAQYSQANNSWKLRLYSDVANRIWILNNWLQEGEDDAENLASSLAVRSLLLPESGALPRPAAARLVNSTLEDYGRIYGYEGAFILDSSARVVAASSESPVPASVLDAGRSVLHTGKFRIDLLRQSPQKSILVFSMPVPGSRTADGLNSQPSVVGVATLLDPLNKELVPLVSAELSSTRTGETLLLGLSGGQGTYISRRRLEQPGGTIVDTLRLAAARAGAQHVTFGDFDDYRGESVFAAMQKLSGVDGVVVSKIDRQEAMADFGQTARLESLAALCLILVYAGSLAGYRRNLRAREMRESLLQQQAALAERKNAEKEILRLNEVLEQRVLDRTAALELANQLLATQVEQRKEAEAALRQSEQRYRELIENANDIIFTIDSEGRFTSLNKAGEQTLGYSRQEALRMKFTQVVAAEFRELAERMVAGRFAEGANATYEVDVAARGGQRVSLEVSVRRMYDGERVAGVQGIARDLTGRKRLEAQFRQMQKMEAVGRLAGGIAHDFNNLLTIIGGYAELLVQRLTEGRFHEYAQQIRIAGDRATSLTQQLLAFSRQQKIAPRLLNLNAIVTGMETMLRRLIGEDVNLVSNLDPELGNVMADHGQVEQVIMNLAVNSRDAMPGGGTLKIETANVDGVADPIRAGALETPGKFVMIAVSDTGAGMSAEVKSHLFEPFFTTKEQGKGTGLGLATVYGVVKQSHGHIQVDSEPGRGATFRIYFPFAPESIRAANPSIEPEKSLKGSETIMLVEDEEAVRSLARLVLETCGYFVLEATRASEAMTLSESHRGPIHLLLTDVVMPQMSGRELADRLKLFRPETRILYMSGYTDDVIVYHGLGHDGADFIQKPFTPDSLIRKVRSMLDAA